jgi:hypothetical protein
VPVDESAPSPEPRRHEYTFGGFPATPLGSLTPCRPSADGGVCGCGEPGDAPASPAISLPGYMASHHAVHISRVTSVWAEVFPGLEASLRSVRTGVAEVDFRLAPADSERHD